jgi:neutral ceramidase
LPRCANSLFLQGACGNINPIRNTTDFADVERYGLMLGAEIVKVAAQLTAPGTSVVTGPITIRSHTLTLAARELPPRATFQAPYDAATQKLAAATSEEERGQWRRKQRMAEEALVLFDRGSAPLSAEVQVIGIGEVALVALPGEPFVELGLDLKQRSPAPHTFVIGYANDWIGYLTPPQAWEQGGYEVSPGPWTLVGPMSGSQLVEQALQLIR